MLLFFQFAFFLPSLRVNGRSFLSALTDKAFFRKSKVWDLNLTKSSLPFITITWKSSTSGSIFSPFFTAELAQLFLWSLISLFSLTEILSFCLTAGGFWKWVTKDIEFYRVLLTFWMSWCVLGLNSLKSLFGCFCFNQIIKGNWTTLLLKLTDWLNAIRFLFFNLEFLYGFVKWVTFALEDFMCWWKL